MPTDQCRATLADYARCAFETTSERVSWAVASIVGLTASLTPNTVAAWGAVLLVLLNCIHVAVKIRNEMRKSGG